MHHGNVFVAQVSDKDVSLQWSAVNHFFKASQAYLIYALLSPLTSHRSTTSRHVKAEP
ncbi:Protein of unknown function [Pyronema omphalodes CBS 100304]|uniref:Uncharacterized protein n=1 Tax=Pyronema omphalodes (strain CBS 100304) TaxID=1076935 RepID=U4LC20_PYROM|nr:Protein of unknown function [Pyronema omphalodes CBS 100304]